MHLDCSSTLRTLTSSLVPSSHLITFNNHNTFRQPHIILTTGTMDNYLYQLSPGAIAVPLLSFITLVLNVPPLVWHTKNHNLAASTLVFWIILCNLFNFINALLWPTDNLTSWWNGVGLCDIEVKLITASTVGIVGSLACIMRNLAAVLDTSNTVLMPSRAQRRRRIVFDSIFCIAFPVYMIIIHYIVQPSRYYIFAISGCTPSFDNSWVSIVLCFIWPPIICLVDAYYCGKPRCEKSS